MRTGKNIAATNGFWLHSVMPDTADAAGAAPGARCRMHVLYSGTVQGVGFRYTVKSVARGFEVTGQVRNLPDGRVELIAEGDRAELEAFRRAIRDAGLAHFIRDEHVTWSAAQGGWRGFEIAG